MPEPLRSS